MYVAERVRACESAYVRVCESARISYVGHTCETAVQESMSVCDCEVCACVHTIWRVPTNVIVCMHQCIHTRMCGRVFT